MKLTDILSGSYNAAEWESKGYKLPQYDIAAVKAKTFAAPTWVHFGGGNIFRAFPAAILNEALNTGKYDRGVIVVRRRQHLPRLPGRDPERGPEHGQIRSRRHRRGNLRFRGD